MEGQTITSSWKFSALIALIVLLPVVSAQVVVNSDDWRDVYSGLQHASITDQRGHFITDTQQAGRVLARLNPDEPVLLITGNTQLMPGFRNLLSSRGFTVEEIRSTNPLRTNEELVLRADPEHVIIIGDAYGFNAVSVGTYATARGAGVLFASSQTASVLNQLSVQSVLVYGHIPSSLLESFELQVTDTINNQDRFDDNFALVERYLQEFPTQVILLANGEIIEDQLISGSSPTLFIGRQTVPSRVTDMILSQDVRTAVLIGNALAPNANVIKDRTGISIFIKFAQGRDQQQFALDLFSVPIPNPLIQVASAEFDPTRQSLLVTYQNPGEIATFFSASLTSGQTVEDAQPVFIEAGSYKTQQYALSAIDGPLAYTILFGASPRTLDLIVQGSVPVSTVEIDDQSEIRVVRARYDTRTESFIVDIENTGSVPVFVLTEAVDVRVGNERARVGSEVVRIPVGQTRQSELFVELTERDLERNFELSLEVFYGQREFSLVQFRRATLGFDVGSSLPFSWTWVILVLVIALVLGWFVTRKKR